ncbi:unnamed protein product [Calypogeia fissa]
MDIRSIAPSQLIAECGSDIVVINFGSANLRIGFATGQSPVVVPHCIAHHVPVPEFVANKKRKKGSVAEQGVSTKYISAPRKIERDEICQMVELQMKMKPYVSDQEGSPKVPRKDWTSSQLNENESFSWTQVVVNNPPFQSDAQVLKHLSITSSAAEDGHHSTPIKRSTEVTDVGPDHKEGISDEPKHDIAEEAEPEIVTNANEGAPRNPEEETQKESEELIEDSEEQRKGPGEEIVKDFEEETLKEPVAETQKVVDTLRDPELKSPTEPKLEVHDGPDLEIHVEVRLEPEDSKSNIDATLQNSELNSIKYRKYICGDEAINIAVSEPYVLRRPICRGHLNVTQQYFLQQVCDDLYSIWDWVLTEKLSLESSTRGQFSVVLVVPDTLDNREVKEVLSVVLRDLNFRSAVVHQESIAATFGNGISTACVVNMGAQVTSIVCVEDGVVIPTTRIILPFGGEDISRCLLWVQQRWQTWPSIDTDPLLDPLDLYILERIKESYCLIIEGDQSAVIEIPYHEGGKPSLVYKGSLTALNVPIMGLFYPSLLAPEEYPAPMRPGFHVDHEDVLDDSVIVDTSKKSDVPNGGLAPLSNGGPQQVAGISEMTAEDNPRSEGSSPEESTLGLSRAIVSSILTTTGRPDLQKKLFASIQLVGGTAYIRGLVDAVEERVLHDIPADEAVDTVAVLQNRTEAPIACWKGGAVLGILDFSRDAWVHYDDWVTGGVRIGCGRKYKDSYILHSQAFYYSATAE